MNLGNKEHETDENKQEETAEYGSHEIYAVPIHWKSEAIQHRRSESVGQKETIKPPATHTNPTVCPIHPCWLSSCNVVLFAINLVSLFFTVACFVIIRGSDVILNSFKMTTLLASVVISGFFSNRSIVVG